MKILIINGPNINMLGIREPEIYGCKTYEELVSYLDNYALNKNITVSFFQSNHEGDLIDTIQNAYFEHYDGIIINPAGYTHTSVAIADAIKAVGISAVEVHISDINKREELRRTDIISSACEKTIMGYGFDSYTMAIDYLIGKENDI